MAKVQIDTVYGIDGGGSADETIQDVIDRLSNEYHVTGQVVGQSTGGGWPVVEWTGPQDNLAELIEGQYDDNSGQTALVRFPEIGDDDEDTFPIVCSNGCPEGYKGIHKFSCSLARPAAATDTGVYDTLSPHAALRRLESLLESVGAREAGNPGAAAPLDVRPQGRVSH